MTVQLEVAIHCAVAAAGPCVVCQAKALYCDPNVREDDLEHVSAPVPAAGRELVGVLRCAVCSHNHGFITWGQQQ